MVTEQNRRESVLSSDLKVPVAAVSASKVVPSQRKSDIFFLYTI